MVVTIRNEKPALTYPEPPPRHQEEEKVPELVE